MPDVWSRELDMPDVGPIWKDYPITESEFLARQVKYGDKPSEEMLVAGRMRHVRNICESTIEFDGGSAMTNRQWLAWSVLNILDGKIDDQIHTEILAQDVP